MAAFLGGAFLAGAFLAGAFLAAVVAFFAGVFLTAVVFFRAVRAVVGVGFSPGVFAAVTPAARLVAVAIFFALAARFGGAFLAPWAFLALLDLGTFRGSAIAFPSCGSCRCGATPAAARFGGHRVSPL